MNSIISNKGKKNMKIKFKKNHPLFKQKKFDHI